MYREVEPNVFRITSAADSIDARQPVILQAVGNDREGNALTQVLKLQFRIHQVNTDSVTWQQLADVPDFTGRVKSLLFGQGQASPLLFVFTESGQAYYTNTSTPTAWSTVTGLPAGFDYASPTVFAGKIYLTAAGKVYASATGTDYVVQDGLSLGNDVETLLGATSGYLAAVKGGYYQSSQGDVWKQGDRAIGFQRMAANSVVYALATNPNIEQIAVWGVGTDNTRHCLLVAENDLLNWGTWGPADSVGYYVPFDEDKVLIRYAGNQFYAFGGTDDEAFDYYYTSSGLYWKKNPNRGFFPETFKGRGHVAAVVDAERYIWIVFSRNNGVGHPAAYRGRLNLYNL
jgi:hypothetical protein